MVGRAFTSCALAAVLLSCLSVFAGESIAPATRPTITLDLGGGVTMKLVRIEPGKFMMGSPETEKGRYPDETQHQVTISKPFYMGVTHVTVDQFATFVKDSGYKTDAEKKGEALGFDHEEKHGLGFKVMVGCSWRNPGFDQKGDHPVVQVSWKEAKAFGDWLSKKSGKTVVLPTEAQWEYACRAGSTTRFGFGDDEKKLGQHAWYSENSNKTTHPVGQKQPNAWGLYDMHGNVWEWCADWYGEYPDKQVRDPKGPDNGTSRVLRGGCLYFPADLCRAASRSRLGETPQIQSMDNIGFRVCVNLD